jgi:hypothetical protein
MTSPSTLPPLTGTPLDYVPIDATPRPIQPSNYRPKNLRNAITAACVAAGLGLAFWISPPACIAIGVMFGAVWVGGRLAARLNAKEAQHDEA